MERARHFRYRAEELRTIAGEWIDSGTREMLGRLAKDYDRKAELWEKQAELEGATEDDVTFGRGRFLGPWRCRPHGTKRP